MNCDEAKTLLADHLRGALAPAEERALRAHLDACAACAAEFADLATLWDRLGELPDEEPGARVRARFDAMLATEIAREAAAAERSRAGAARVLAFRGAPAVAGRGWAAPAFAAAATLLVGLGLGFFAGRSRTPDAELATLHEEVRSLHGLVAVSLLENSSASERLEGVSYGRRLSGSDEKVTGALLKALENDPNESVRLAAIDALAPLAALPAGRAELAAAAARQKSPSVTMSLVDLLLESGAPASELESLAAQNHFDPTVRSYLRARLGGRA